ncbi:hypothetical protein EDC94DRAFT_664603 [Helicostylum pulchrum]|nr:hypothetical protein EDC94DRAFT_664603 [Helicostylum pulchrum]
MMEGRNAKEELIQNIRPIDVNTKRYSVPQSFKSSFYAIHHIQRADSATENTESLKPKNSPSPSSSSPSSTTTTTTTTIRSRKRPSGDPTKNCKRSRSVTTKVRKTSAQDTTPQLYQTCVGIWPENKTLEEHSYDNIKSLSNLLKVRLCQAKFKMMAKLDGDNELFAFLADEYVTPKHKLPCVIKLNQRKQHKSSLSVVGNGKNLFSRNDPAKSVAPVSENINATDTKRKRRRKKSHNTPNPVKVTRRSKKRSAAADIPPVTLSDGSTVYVCEPCHKKYKNRNGLSYHLQRCKYRTKEEKEGSGLQEESVINCICTQNTDEHGTMVQCDKCQIWLHSECVGLTEDALDDAFHCASCKEKISTDLLQSLIDTVPAAAAAEPEPEESLSSQDQINKHLHELFCQTPPDDEEEGDDEDEEEDVFGMAVDDNSEALHVWDDFSFSSTLEKSNNEPWNLMDDDYENDNPSSSWTMNDMALFSQPPSLLFSDPMSSALEDVTTPVHVPSESTPKHDSTPLPLSETTPNSVCEASSVCDATTPTVNPHTPIHTADGLWFQFANFDDDYQCET